MPSFKYLHLPPEDFYFTKARHVDITPIPAKQPRNSLSSTNEEGCHTTASSKPWVFPIPTVNTLIAEFFLCMPAMLVKTPFNYRFPIHVLVHYCSTILKPLNL